MKYKKDKINIGWAEADITPKEKCELAGQYYQRVSRGIHSRLTATVLAMKSESGEQAVMISVDLLNFGFEFIDSLRRRLKRRVPAIISEKIVVNATHTHSAPGVRSGRKWRKRESKVLETDDYRRFVLNSLVDAVQDAWKNLKPASIVSSRTSAAVGHCRRAVYTDCTAEMYGDTSRDDFDAVEGNEDSDVELLFTYDEKKQPVGAVVNVACPSQVMEATYLVSSDYMGEMRRLLKTRFGSEFKILCQISAAGDQSPHDLIRPNVDLWNARGVEVLGHRLATAVIHAFNNIDKKDIKLKIEMKHSVRKLCLPKRFPSYRDAFLAEKDIKRLEAVMSSKKAFAAFNAELRRNDKVVGRPGPYDSKLHHFVLIRNAEAVVRRWAERSQELDYVMELHVIRAGNVVFCTNPFELFLDYGQRIKARSRAECTFVIQLACCMKNGGYLPTVNAERNGGYGGLIVNGVVGSEGGDKLVEETLYDIKELFG